MLSFMRDQGTGNSAERPSEGIDSQDLSSPDAAGAQEFLTVATTSKSLRRSTMLVAILVGVGLVVLGLMIRKSQPQAAAARQGQEEQTKIEAAIGRLTGASTEMVDRMDEIVKKFYEFSDVFQIKVGELTKNPFEVQGYMKDLKGQVVVTEDDQTRAEMMRRQRLQQKASTLKLLSIMQGERGNSCMINDRILRQGDEIEGCTVTQIGSNSVELSWAAPAASGTNGSETADTNIVLKLSE